MTKATPVEPLAGDHVEIVGHRVGEAQRHGEIIEVLGTSPHQHFQVRWQDGRVSLLYPGADVEIIHRSDVTRR